MDSLKLVECTGYTREEAFQNLDFNPMPPLLRGCNCTQAWVTEGRPTPGTRAFSNFATKQLSDKTQMKPGYGLYITLEPSQPDTRKKPCAVITQKVTSSRRWSSIVYMIVEVDMTINTLPEQGTDDEGQEIEIGESKDITVLKRKEIIGICESLAEAKAKMKELTIMTHKDYVAMVVKVPDILPEAAYCVYTPSINAKKGKFLAFGISPIVTI